MDDEKVNNFIRKMRPRDRAILRLKAAGRGRRFKDSVPVKASVGTQEEAEGLRKFARETAQKAAVKATIGLGLSTDAGQELLQQAIEEMNAAETLSRVGVSKRKDARRVRQ